MTNAMRAGNDSLAGNKRGEAAATPLAGLEKSFSLLGQ
jgi:hypothetical protein